MFILTAVSCMCAGVWVREHVWGVCVCVGRSSAPRTFPLISSLFVWLYGVCCLCVGSYGVRYIAVLMHKKRTTHSPTHCQSVRVGVWSVLLVCGVLWGALCLGPHTQIALCVGPHTQIAHRILPPPLICVYVCVAYWCAVRVVCLLDMCR